ncbi:nucleotide exchange factor GrpE [Jannaschia sp. Os4]|uniref:nucleotide exchange factor GrpE n=1 Tax=Jannaschia sp. Os4 TaxID=2807617 RepID=UPI00193958ED|nr:nucleotide exchange factor GrpE [Jannaschia sp. Os4]MBM2575558.1 nucleotide exchange factor GrpE [Jannaschia sp. Os4]
MADPREHDPESFLDDPEAVEEEDLDEEVEITGSPSGAPSNDDAAPSAAVEAVIAERDEMRDRMMRALAEAENARKRAARDRDEASRYGGTKLARDLLPVHDNLKRAMEAAEGVAGSEAILEGLQLTLRSLEDTFEKHGVTVVAPAEGDVFDPEIHEAMFEAPVPGTVKGQVIQLVSEGFLLHDRLLRPAKVGVSSTPA